MSKQEIVKIFGDRKVRSVWDDKAEKWYFAIVDVVAVLTDSKNPAIYWRVLKNRLKKEGNETVTNCNGLKMTAAGQHDCAPQGRCERRQRGAKRPNRNRAQDRA